MSTLRGSVTSRDPNLPVNDVLSAIPARDLRNHTADVLRRVEAGEEIEVLKDNRPVAKIIPLAMSDPALNQARYCATPTGRSASPGSRTPLHTLPGPAAAQPGES